MPHSAPIVVLLAAADPALLAGLCDAAPELTVQPLGRDLPEPAPGTTVLCYIDWLLPEGSGIELVRRLREARATRDAHITLVLDDGDAEIRRRALKAGADDYLIGPLTTDLLRARIASHHAPATAAQLRQRLVHGDLVLDLGAHQARYRGAAVPLRPNEFRLLMHFIAHPDQVFSRAALIDRLGKDDDTIDERTVDVWVGRLRRALAAHGAPDPLRTVRSLGYVLDSLPDALS